MPVQISKSMLSKMPEAERANAETALWDKSGGRCFLCEEKFNLASDEIHPDHDIPEAEGGATDLANLNLAHASCNKAKRNAKSIDIRPYLKLVAFQKNHGGRLKYDGFLPHFKIEPKKTVAERVGTNIVFDLPTGESISSPVYSETNLTGTHYYTYVPLPRSAIFNDDACQPRVVRTDHAWSIYCDLQRNVLHEPPSCRMESENYGKPVRLLLFDGQHKTIASWMLGRDEVTCKVYLNMSTARANELVNSIQAKIKKLPLSPFELAGKMSDEWENKFSEYEDAVGMADVSEAGFLGWLPQTDRARGKSALQSALIQNVLTSPDLRITNHVKRQGSGARAFGFTEQQLKAKVLEKLIIREPRTETGEAAQEIRDKEATNIIKVLNALNDAAFEPSDGTDELTDVQTERARRMCYQASLAYITTLIRLMWNHVAFADPKQPMSADLTGDANSQLATGIRLLVDHPVWTAQWDRDGWMEAVKIALEKNQGADSAFEDVGLTLEYMVLGKGATSYKKYWG